MSEVNTIHSGFNFFERIRFPIWNLEELPGRMPHLSRYRRPTFAKNAKVGHPAGLA